MKKYKYKKKHLVDKYIFFISRSLLIYIRFNVLAYPGVFLGRHKFISRTFFSFSQNTFYLVNSAFYNID